MDWSTIFPGFVEKSSEVGDDLMEGIQDETTDQKPPALKKLTRDVEVADIGCGFGGLLIALAPLLPDTLILGNQRGNDP
jgi:tRNA (guanine-N7-)-methyltransferase